jgi:hypothetical protein
MTTMDEPMIYTARQTMTWKQATSTEAPLEKVLLWMLHEAGRSRREEPSRVEVTLVWEDR